MGRFVLHFFLAALAVSTCHLIFRSHDNLLWEFFIMIAGIGVICLFGFEILIATTCPTKEKSRDIRALLATAPQWKNYLIWLGWLFGATAALVFYITADQTPSAWVVGIPIAIFFVPSFLLQYVVPKWVLRRIEQQNQTDAPE